MRVVRSEDAIELVRTQAERRNYIVIAPKSRGMSWDAIHGAPGPDVETIDAALEYVFAYHDVNPEKIAIGGFSDGASYALTLGLANGDLFQDVLAFSPGFSVNGRSVGRPKVYISHGRRDTVLPFEETGELLAKQLGASGYVVNFDPFGGGHTVPADKLRTAFDWWLHGRARSRPT